MRASHSQLVGLPIHLVDEEVKVGVVREVVLDPDRGSLVALVTRSGQAVAPRDLLPFGGGCWDVRETEALIEMEELIRLQSVPIAKRTLIHKSVFTQSGEFLGKVEDYDMDMDTLQLIQIHVSKTFFFTAVDRRVIDWKEIVEITEKAVVVKNQQAEVHEPLEEVLTLKKKVEAPASMARLRD